MRCPICANPSDMEEQAAFVTDKNQVEIEFECTWCDVKFEGVLIKTRQELTLKAICMRRHLVDSLNEQLSILDELEEKRKKY